MTTTPDRGPAASANPAAPGRSDHWFDSSGTPCAAWFYPAAGATGADGPAPVVVMGHGLGGTRHMRLDAYARRFAVAGIAAVVFDYRGFGDSAGWPRQIVDVQGQVADWHAALAFVRSGELPVDTARVAIWGTSFGGGHVMQVAAEDGALAAVVAQCPFSDGLASVLRRTLHNPISATVLGAAAVLDAVVGRITGRPLLMPMAGAGWMPAFLASRDSLGGAAGQVPVGSTLGPRSSRWVRRLPGLRRRVGGHLVLTEGTATDADSVWGTVRLPDGATVINAIAARLVLTLGLYRPGRALRRTAGTPVLLCVCDRDRVAPPGPTLRAADGLANVEVRRYDVGHFDIYLGASFEEASADQLAFLQRTLLDAGR